jgi:hypothetical protein
MPVDVHLTADRVLSGSLVGLAVVCLVLLAVSQHFPRWCKTANPQVGTIGLWSACSKEPEEDGLCRRIGSDAFTSANGNQKMTAGASALFSAAQGMAIASFIFTFMVVVALLIRVHVGVVVFMFVVQIVLITATIGTMAGACDSVHNVQNPQLDLSMGCAIGALFCVVLSLAAQVYALIRGKESFGAPEPDMSLRY